EALRGALLALDEAAKPRLVARERHPMIATGRLQLAGEDHRPDHGERAALPREQRDAERRVTDERDAAAAPRGHPDLAHAIQVDRPARAHRAEDLRAPPAAVREAAAQPGALRARLVRDRLAPVVGPHEEKERAIAAHREARGLLAALGVEDVDALVTRPVAR